jgi:hypothetical protein
MQQLDAGPAGILEIVKAEQHRTALAHRADERGHRLKCATSLDVSRYRPRWRGHAH